MNGPRRLLEQPGPAARLLRAADTHVPGERARRLALLSAGSAAATIAASGSSAAAGGGVLLKSVFVWLSAGALGGAAVTVVATNALQSPLPAVHETAPVTAITPRVRVPLERPTPAVSSALSEQAPATPPPRDDTPAPVPSQRSTTPRDVAESDQTRAASAPSVARFTSEERTNPGLYDQLRLIDDARSAAARRDTFAALGILDNYDRSYPRGQFVPESLALRIETVARAGDSARARALAVQFRRDYPQHPLSARVAAALGD